MKKILIVLINIFIIFNLYSQSINDNLENILNGAWISEEGYIKNNNYFKIHYAYGYKEITEYTYVIKIDGNKGKFWFVGEGQQFIISYNVDNNLITLVLADNEDGKGSYQVKILWNEPNSITITRWNETQTYYRMDGPDKNFIQKAVTNTENVKVFVKPSETSFSWGTFSKNSNLSIREKSDKPETINGETYYWYRVSNPKLPDGWVFGKYMTFVDEFEKEDVPEPIVKSVKKEEPVLSRVEVLKYISFLAADIKNDATHNKEDCYFNNKKQIYIYKGNTLDNKKDYVEITNNYYHLPNNISINMRKEQLLKILGEPNAIKNDQLIYYERYGNIYEYKGIFIIKNDLLEKIIVEDFLINGLEKK